MHIPDGFLSGYATAGLAAASAANTAAAAALCRRTMDERRLPLLGVTAAFVFAAQMLNFPIAGGTSGHFMGAALAAVVLGPWAGSLVMTTVLIIQCLVFQDGGLLALGANVFNMAVVGVWVAWACNSLLGGSGAGVALGSWLSVVVAATACALELAASGTAPISHVVPAMAGVHALIGLVEAGITVAAVAFVRKVRPDVLAAGPGRGGLVAARGGTT